MTERELLICHAEIKALQQLYGLSYKDAAQCLYQAEVSKLKAEEAAYEAFHQERVVSEDTITREIYEEIKKIDSCGQE